MKPIEFKGAIEKALEDGRVEGARLFQQKKLPH